MVSLLILS